MRILEIIVLALISVSQAEEHFKFSETNHEFRRRNNIFLFNLSPEGAKDDYRVCFATFTKKADGSSWEGVNSVEDLSDCRNVQKYGLDDTSFLRLGVYEGRSRIGVHRTLKDDEKVSVKGKIWGISSNAKVIYRAIGKDNQGIQRFATICKMTVRPVSRVDDDTSPEKTLFCRPVGPITTQGLDDNGKLLFAVNGAPKMIDTMICPLPAKCLSEGWVITPSDVINPNTDLTAAHAGQERVIHENVNE